MDHSGWFEMDRLPIPDLVWMRDLIYFDGPLLSEFRSSNGDTYLFHWCDVDEGLSRWMVFRVSRSELVRYMFRRLSLRTLIEESQDGVVYIVDIDANREHKRVFLVPLGQVPEDFLPEPSSLLVFDGHKNRSHSYATLIDGKWEIEDLAQFPRRFTEVYTFLYLLGQSDRKPPHATHMFSYDFAKGRGWAARHFFRELQQQIPIADKPGVEEIQYASPGFISLHMNPDLGSVITAAVARYVDNQSAILDSYEILDEFVRGQSIPDDDDDAFDVSVNESVESAQDYVAVSQELSRRLGYVDWDRLYQACDQNIKVAARILLIYCRRLKILAGFQAVGKAELL